MRSSERTRSNLPALVWLALVCAVASGCEKASTDSPAPPAPCKAVGQRCEYAPGKLGTCVLRDGCVGDACFVCQSQH